LYFRTYENNISEDLVAFISIVEVGVRKFLRKVGTSLQNYTSSGAKGNCHSRRHEGFIFLWVKQD